MTSRDFCYWLQGYFEVNGERKDAPVMMTTEQIACIRAHLALVFKHEIDPSQGSPAHQAELQEIHDKPASNPYKAVPGPHFDPGVKYRC